MPRRPQRFASRLLLRRKPGIVLPGRRILSDPLSSVATRDEEVSVIIDCDSCQMRDVACDDCVVTALLSAGTGEEIGGETVDALRVLADGGLVPPLRMQWPQASSG